MTNPWEEYERRKKALPDDLTPEERDKAIAAILEELNL